MSNEISFDEILKLNRHYRKNSDFKSPEINYRYGNELANKNQSFFKYVRKIYEENPNITDKEVAEKVLKFVENCSISLLECSSFRSDSLRLDTAIQLSDNVSDFNRIYNELIEEEKTNKKPITSEEIITFSSNQEVSKRQLLKDLISTYRRDKNMVFNELPELKPGTKQSKLNKRSIMNFLRDRDKSSAELIKIYLEDDECKSLKLLLNKKIKDFEKDLKEKHKKSIKQILSKLNEMGVLDKYMLSHNKLYSDELGFPELNITPEEFKEAYSDEILNNLDITTLSSLDSFWINRYTKEISNFNLTYFLASDLNLWSDIKNAQINEKNNKLEINIPKKVLEAELEKMSFLENVYNNYIDETNVQIQKTSNKNVVVADIAPVLGKINQDINSDYKTYFSRVNDGAISKSKNDFLEDFLLFYKELNVKKFSYQLKDYIMISQLSKMFNIKKSSKNWGITYEKNKNGFQRNMMLLSIDIVGINMPQRLHISKYCLEDFLRANQNSSRIPIYQGEGDFYRNKSLNISTPIMLPLLPKRKKIIRELSNKIDENHPNYKFIQHLNFLAGGALPMHLKSSEPNSNKKRLIQRLYDLLDGKIYKQNADRTYTEDIDFLSEKNSIEH